MKTTKKLLKTILSLLLICTLALGLTGCDVDWEALLDLIIEDTAAVVIDGPVNTVSPVPEDSPFIGKWDMLGSTADMYGMNIEELKSLLGDFTCYLEFTADGQCILFSSIYGADEKIEMTYTAEGDTLTVDGDTINWLYRDGMLILWDDEQRLTLPRYTEPGAAAEPADIEDPAEEVIPGDPAGLIGIWDASEAFADQWGISVDYLKLLAGSFSITVEFTAEGKCIYRSDVFGEIETEESEYTADGTTVTSNGISLNWKLENGVLSLWDDTRTVSMPRAGAESGTQNDVTGSADQPGFLLIDEPLDCDTEEEPEAEDEWVPFADDGITSAEDISEDWLTAHGWEMAGDGLMTEALTDIFFAACDTISSGGYAVERLIATGEAGGTAFYLFEGMQFITEPEEMDIPGYFTIAVADGQTGFCGFYASGDPVVYPAEEEEDLPAEEWPAEEAETEECPAEEAETGEYGFLFFLPDVITAQGLKDDGWNVMEEEGTGIMDDDMQALFDRAFENLAGAVYTADRVFASKVLQDGSVVYLFEGTQTIVYPDAQPAPGWIAVLHMADQTEDGTVIFLDWIAK
ncbi:MAG: hypothetical protein CW338_02160 [Clostridiales bacterium]|nr:hypothetical protein [Clostridiales bacterium]